MTKPFNATQAPGEEEEEQIKLYLRLEDT
jgi:hypothetical protein